MVWVIIRIKLNICISNRGPISIERTHICLTTTTEDVINHHSLAFNLHKKTFLTGHTPLITTTIEVTNRTSLQIPTRTDSHICLVVATEKTSNLEFITTGVGEGCVDTHLVLKAVIGQEFTGIISIRIRRIFDAVDNLARVIQADNGSFRHCGIVTTTVCINDRTTMNIKECLAYMRWGKFIITGSHFHIILLGIINSLGTLGS